MFASHALKIFLPHNGMFSSCGAEPKSLNLLELPIEEAGSAYPNR